LLPADFLALNRTTADYPRDKTIAQLFAEQVEKSPEAIAVIAGSVQLTYRDLNARSDDLALHLQKLGVEPDDLVGIATERSEYMLIAILAVLKAGGAYVPLDPEYPGARVSAMVEDSSLSLILTTTLSQSKFPVTSANVIVLDGLVNSVPSSSQNVVSAATSSNLAYVIYTSGSTGKPKGVMIEHRNVVNFFVAMDRLIGNTPGVWLAVTSIAFDISVLELLWTLTRGFTVVLHRGNNPQSVAHEIREFGVTHLQSTPSLARILTMDTGVLAALADLKVLLLGGEALPASLVAEIRTVFSGDLFNMYGPTETTIWSSAYQVTAVGTSVPIGVPIANNFIYILDENLRPVADGQPGALFIGGEGVVRGYLGKPELTAERFLPDPFSPGGKMYWTGDVARLLPSGNVDFLGRMDHQVKIRGFRIELGEIEAILEELSEVHQAVVVARQDKPGDIRLIAYIVRPDGLTADPASLRSHVRERLPVYMVPTQFVFVDSLPLTANGKIDRNALPAPLPELANSMQAAPPQITALESTLIEIFSDALGLPQIPLNANFFDLGAHSLLISEVHSRLQDKLAREISLVDLFEFTTIASLAHHLGGAEYPASAPFSSRAQRRRESRSARGD
jgi:amino acid adenylation domain-containing protein